ncbi:eukaryotic translation initiation factor 3 subunit E [Camelus ferus]|nr:eukaryotic translation initiation factor 3 subunit E [Camelus ferus]
MESVLSISDKCMRIKVFTWYHLDPTRQEYLDTLYRYAKFQYECGNYSGAAEYLYFFRVLSVSSPLQSLQQRTWLIHWSLFVFFNHPKGRDNIIDLFLYQPQYLNAIQTMCPHILRYLTTAVITNKDVRKRRQVLKDLVKVIQQESYTYKDPITEFVECLYVNFDFDGAQKKLRECESGHVVMGNNAVSPYQQVIEKTKSLSFRSQMLAMNIEKKLNQNSRSEVDMWTKEEVQVSSNILKHLEEVTWEVNPFVSSATANTGAIEILNQICVSSKSQ